MTWFCGRWRREPERRYQHVSDVKTAVEALSAVQQKRETIPGVRDISARSLPGRQPFAAGNDATRFFRLTDGIVVVLCVLGTLVGVGSIVGLFFVGEDNAFARLFSDGWYHPRSRMNFGSEFGLIWASMSILPFLVLVSVLHVVGFQETRRCWRPALLILVGLVQSQIPALAAALGAYNEV